MRHLDRRRLGGGLPAVAPDGRAARVNRNFKILEDIPFGRFEVFRVGAAVEGHIALAGGGAVVLTQFAPHEERAAIRQIDLRDFIAFGVVVAVQNEVPVERRIARAHHRKGVVRRFGGGLRPMGQTRVAE